jgi:hypothetical protein
MRGLAVAFLAALCGSLGAPLWGRFMTDAPDWMWRLAFFCFWVAVGLIAVLTDPINEQVKQHPKEAVIIGSLWLIFWGVLSQTKQLRSARLTMRFTKGKSPYEEPGMLLQIGTVLCQGTVYRLSVESDKTAQVSVTIDGISLDGYERHDIPLHRMGDLTNKETVTEVSKGRPRYWDVLTYAQSQGHLSVNHIQSNLPQVLYPKSQTFTVIATAPGTQEVSRTVKVAVDESGNLSFSLGQQ